jgi:hypothetical protein
LNASVHPLVLAGLVPLMLEHRWAFRRLLFIGKVDQLDLLARKGWEDKVFEAGVRTLRQMMGSWHVVDQRAGFAEIYAACSLASLLCWEIRRSSQARPPPVLRVRSALTYQLRASRWLPRRLFNSPTR